MASIGPATTTAVKLRSSTLNPHSSTLSPSQQCITFTKSLHSFPYLGSTSSTSRRGHVADSSRCMAAGAAAAEATEAKKKSRSKFEIQTLTNWLLKQEQAGIIDAELTIVLSSISMACKQIASLVQRAGISDLTGGQGAVNIQGEDQKKLDVVSNEVIC